MSQYEFLTIGVEHGVASIQMNRAPLNVLHIPMMRELNSALDELIGNPAASVLLISSTVKAFSAGVDISDHTPEKVDEMIEVFHGIFRRLESFKIPTVAAVDGAALGGGCELAIACDIVLASEKAKFGQPEIKVGVFPPIAAALLPKKIGWGRALDFISSGDTILAAQAEQWSMVTKVFPVEGFNDACQAFVQRYVSNSRIVLEYTKQAAFIGATHDFQTALPMVEKLYLNQLMKTVDACEGLQAFLDKRTPHWKNC